MNFTNLYLIVVLFFLSCNRNVTRTTDYFTVKESYYETWMASETEKGTTIVVLLENIKDGVEIDSLVFNGNQLPVTIANSNGIYTVTAQLTAPSAKLATKIIRVNKPNELVYRVNSEKLYCLLKDLKGRKMRYLGH